MTDLTALTDLGTTTGGENSVAAGVKTALGSTDRALQSETDSSESTFVDVLKILLAPASQERLASDTGKSLPLASEAAETGLAAAQLMPATAGMRPDTTSGGSALTQAAKALSGLQLQLQSQAQTHAGLASDTLAKSASGLLNIPANTVAAMASSEVPMLKTPDTALPDAMLPAVNEAASQLRASTNLAGLQSAEMSAIKSVVDTILPSSSTVPVDQSAAAMLRAPTAQSSQPGSSAPTVATSTIYESFGRPEWNQGMGKQVLWMINHNVQTAELKLNPAHLGPIEVRIKMEDEQVSVAFSSRHAAVREAVELALPRLREMFEDSGVSLAGTDISQQSFAEQRENQLRNEARTQAGNQAEVTVDEEQPASQAAASRHGDVSMIDYYI